MKKIDLFVPRCADVRDEKELADYGVLVLSLVGDGVHTLFLRCALSASERYRNEDLHARVAEYAKAESQAKDAKTLLPYLSETEKRVYNRGKNAHFKTVPKHATKYEYSLATAFEALTGYLYLSGKTDRLCELYKILYEESDTEVKESDTETLQSLNKEEKKI
ncbi:MAG: ribonuclease III [Clostridia bacterium]|nr:ribonuclease III [Clostridia bacterium]